jgi:hypothetical protein
MIANRYLDLGSAIKRIAARACKTADGGSRPSALAPATF